MQKYVVNITQEIFSGEHNYSSPIICIIPLTRTHYVSYSTLPTRGRIKPSQNVNRAPQKTWRPIK